MAYQDLTVEEQQEIIEEFKADSEVFAKVYDFYYRPIFGYILKRVMSSEVAYDIVSEAFMKAFNNFHKFQWKGISIKIWLYRIATNELNTYRRKPKEYALPEDFQQHPDLITDCKKELSKLDTALFGDDELAELSDAIGTLNPKYQNVLSLYYFTGLSQVEIAEVINKSEGAVKAMIHRAITQLRSLMKKSKLANNET